MNAAEIKRLARLAFPEYKGRKFRYSERRSYSMSDFWDGGSREYVKAVDLAAPNLAQSPSALSGIPWSGAATAAFQIPAGVALVTHSIFQGRDCGITVIVACIDAECLPCNRTARGIQSAPMAHARAATYLE